MRIFVSGALGNLGSKLISHLCSQSWCTEIVGVDIHRRKSYEISDASPKLIVAQADLTDPTDRRWRDLMAGCDAVVHFAVCNIMPDSSWQDAAESFSMTSNLLDAAKETGVRRFVFSSSNHVMGGYKDPPLSVDLKPGGLTPDLPPSPGTWMLRAGVKIRPCAYGAAKLFGEKAVHTKARASGGRLTGVAIRIGWCQAGQNHPSTLSASGSPPGNPAAVSKDVEDDPVDVAWFRGMWLSNRDFGELMNCALLSDTKGWPNPSVVVNGVSANTNMAWDLEHGRRLIGYDPKDDAFKELGLVP